MFIKSGLSHCFTINYSKGAVFDLIVSWMRMIFMNESERNCFVVVGIFSEKKFDEKGRFCSEWFLNKTNSNEKHCKSYRFCHEDLVFFLNAHWKSFKIMKLRAISRRKWDQTQKRLTKCKCFRFQQFSLF